MKVFSTKSRKISFITLCATCLASFLCAAIILLANSGLFAVAQGKTLDLTVNYVSGQTLAELDLGTEYEGYSFTNGDALVPVGTNTYTLTKEGSADLTLNLTVNEPLTNVEDVMDTVSAEDFSYTVCGSSSISVDSRKVLFTQGYAEGKYGSNYWSINTTTRTVGSNYQNGNNYDGNISIYSSIKDATTVGVSLNKTDKYGVIKIRTTLSTNYRYSFNMMREDGKFGYNSKTGGYGINLQRASNDNGIYFTSQFFKVTSPSGTATSTQLKDYGTNWYVSGEVDVFVTYGVYPVNNDGAIANKVVFMIETIAADGQTTVVLNESKIDTTPDALIANGTSFTIDAKYVSTSGGCLMLEGVNRPLFATENFEIVETYEEGTALSEIELPDGVDAWKDSTQIVTFGENTYIGLVNSEYYGAESYEVAVAVTGGEKTFATSVADVKYVNGLTVNDIKDKLASGFAFADLTKELVVGENELEGTYTDAVLGEKKAIITVTVVAPDSTNIENLIDKEADASLYVDGQVIEGWANGSVTGNSVNSNFDAGTLAYRIYTITKDENSSSTNAHKGNLSIYGGAYDADTDDACDSSTGIVINNSEKYGFVSARVTLNKRQHFSFGMMNEVSSDIEAFAYNNYSMGGYKVYLQGNSAGDFAASIIKVKSDGTRKVLGTEYYYTILSELAPNGTDVVVTWGVVPVAEGNQITVKIELDGVLLNSTTVTDTETSNLKLGSGDLKFTIGNIIGSYGATFRRAYTIEGVNDSLLGISGNYDKTVDDATYPEKQALSNVTVDGYEWVNGETILNCDNSTYDANYLYDYYGTTVKIPAKVTLQLSPVGRTELLLKNGETTLASYALDKGESKQVGLTEEQIASLDGTFIGWFMGDDTQTLYKPDYTFTATADETTTVILNVAVLDFAIVDGAQFKTNGVGGIRFMLALNSADWAKVGNFVTNAKGVIVPFDNPVYYDNGFTAKAIDETECENFIGQVAKDGASIADEYEGYQIYTFVLGGIQYHNFNRDFAAMAFIDVAYTGVEGTVRFNTEFDATKHVGNIHELARTAYGFGATAGVKYLANTIEVALDGSEIIAEDFYGLDVERTYELTNYQVNGKEITLTLSVKDGSLLETEDFAAVYFKDASDFNAHPTRYKGAIAFDASTNTAVVTFTIA